MTFSRLAALLSNLGIELWSPFLFDSFATFLPNLGVKLRAILFAHGLAAMFCLLRSRFWSTLVVCHRKSRLSYALTSTLPNSFRGETFLEYSENISLLSYRD